jgi:hypothetical protein
MKKIYSLLVMLLIAGYIYGQSANLSGVKERISLSKAAKMSPAISKKLDASQLYSKKGVKSTEEAWFDYAIAKQNQVGATNNLRAERLFPDTTVIVKYSNGDFPPWIHAISVVLDPTDEVFYDDQNPQANYTRANKFKVDSVAILCIYSRHNTDPDIVDTLKIEVATDVGGPMYYFTGMSNNFGYDTVYFCGVKHDSKYNYVKPATSSKVITKKIPLTKETEFDTISGGWNYIVVPLPEAQFTTGASLAIATFRFIPGYSWIPNQDTLNRQLNEFMFVTYEENGSGTYPSYTPKKYNTSQVLSSEAKFNTGSSFYKASLYIPSVAYTAPFVLENHLVDFKLTTNNVGVIENSEKTVKLNQNVPNPANNLTYISYELKGNNNVNLVITDLTGKKVMEFNQGYQQAGNHYITVNTGSLSNGMYYYTLNADNTRLSRKMIINK